MNYTIFKLSYILYLQKKYYPTFKLGNENVYVLPPVLKRKGLFFSLAFPVAKRFDKNTISRPVGVILVSKKGKEKSFDMSNFEFTNYSQDFERKYTYKTYQQEHLKVTLHLLLSCYPKFSIFATKKYSSKYLPLLKQSFDEEYWNFYEDLISNRISKISNNVYNDRKFVIENGSQKNHKKKKCNEKIKKEVDFELKNFVKNEIWGYFKDKNAFYKLAFLDLLGEVLRNDYDFSNKEQIIEKQKYEIAKAYAKAVNILKIETENIDFVSKLLIIFLNSMLIEEKEKKVIEYFETQIKDSCNLLDSNLKKIKDKKIKNILSSIYSLLKNDYSVVDKKEFSNIFFAYLFLFLN